MQGDAKQCRAKSSTRLKEGGEKAHNGVCPFVAPTKNCGMRRMMAIGSSLKFETPSIQVELMRGQTRAALGAKGSHGSVSRVRPRVIGLPGELYLGQIVAFYYSSFQFARSAEARPAGLDYPDRGTEFVSRDEKV